MAEVVKSQKAKKNRPKYKQNNDDEEPLTQNGQTKAKFDELLKQAAIDNMDGKVGKKKKKKKDDIVLEALRNDLKKDGEDKTLLANTYDPDDLNHEKSNKRRQRELEKKKGTDNEAFDDEEDIIDTEKEKKAKKKKKKSDKDLEITEISQKVNKKDRKPRSPSPEPEDFTEKKTKKKKKERVPSPEPDSEPEPERIKEKKTKKKKKKRKEESGTENELDRAASEEDLDQSEDHLNQSDPNMVSEENLHKTKEKKKKKKKKKAQGEEEGLTSEDGLEEEPPRIIEDEGRILGVIVHRTDKLKTDFYVSHPMVRIYVIDLETGTNLKKQTRDRPVSSYYESSNENVDFVLPIMTQPFDFKQKKSTLPVWEELVLFNENFNYFVTDNPQVLLLFELIDFASMGAATRNPAIREQGGWYRIAWAFLKLLGANGQPNTDRKVRLQLYQPPVRFRAKGDQLEVYQWYKSAQRTPYPSTLYVTAKQICPPETVEPSSRSMFATQAEIGRVAFEEMQKTLELGSNKGGETKRRRNPTEWSRLAGQVCKVPNESFLIIQGGRKGCHTVKFSHDGRFLACGCREKDSYPIKIYEIPSGKLKFEYNGHYGIIYDLCWSKNDKNLMTASGDSTARILDIESNSSKEMKVMPHPSFVYTAQYHVRVAKLAVTGGYDHVIRVWNLQTDDTQAQLVQELDGHFSHVNSLCFDEEGSRMYSGDGLGMVRIWNVYATDQPSKKGISKDWTLLKELSDNELKGAPINYLQMHANGKRLLVHTRDNTIKMIDLRVNAVMTRFQGALNYKEKIRSTLSPCGTFVITGSEDCNLYIWNADTGDQVAMFPDLKYKTPVTCVDYHPHDHMMALCAYGENEPIIIYRYTHKAALREVGLEEELETPSKRTGRPGSPHLWKEPTDQKDSKLETAREKLAHKSEDFRSEEMARLDRINKKLNTVTAQMLSRPLSPEHPLGVPRGASPMQPWGASTMQSTWGSTFDSTALLYSQYSPRSTALAPSALSPHAAGNNLQARQQQAQIAAQADYMSHTSSGWRPSFSAVAQSGRSSSPTFGGRPPHLTLNTTGGRPQFTFQQHPGKAPPPQEVVALYDYQAARSDELSMMKGDLIKVLYKDNDNWWMGETSDGQQGFFPANYVTTVDGGDPNADGISDEEVDTHRTTAAVVTKSGDLKFVSGTEDSDAEQTPRVSKIKKKTKKPGMSLTFEDEVSTPTRPARKKKSRRKPAADSEA